MIDKLERLVKTLNHEKEQYRKQIRDLQSEWPLLFLPFLFFLWSLFFHHFLCSVLKKKREAFVIIWLLQAPVKGYWNCPYWYLIQNNTSFCGTLPVTRMTLFEPEQGGLMQNVCMKVSETRCTYWHSLPPSISSFFPSLSSLPSWWLSGEVGNTSMDVSDAYTKHAPPSFQLILPSFFP